ncbi:MAG: FAD-dependent thymidylate synthase [Elusimicrobiota bacterium]|jgi:thymidylate synthase ThyX
MTHPVRSTSPEPVVILENAFQDSYNNSVATARTCYSSKVIHAEDVSNDEAARARRDGIAESIYKAGHHTTIQHATFQFVLDKVSRQFIWSFLHSHPFYNSEQVSQRYVEVKPGNFTIPALRDDHVAFYQQAILEQMETYHDLCRLLEPTVAREYQRIFPARSTKDKNGVSAIRKRCQEVARYALPVATHAHLYHTISGLTLHRYHRLCEQFDAPVEQKIVIRKMVDAVNRFDPEFFKFIEDPLPLEKTLEYQLINGFDQGARGRWPDAFVREFDQDLGGYSSKLVDYKANAEAVLAQGVRSVLGLPKNQMSDETAIDAVLNPARNPYLSETLNLSSISKLMRVLSHPHFTFKKKISHAADSQNQRHRMTPGSRPVLIQQVRWNEPDYIIPALIQATPEALDYYRRSMQRLWTHLSDLVNAGEKEEDVLYLLPNAFPIRFEESGELLNFHHKWTQRLCYNAQEEIWKISQEEVLQLQKRFPLLGRYFGAPCWMRQQAGVKPFCPEGDRFCGVTVWKLPIHQYQRFI